MNTVKTIPKIAAWYQRLLGLMIDYSLAFVLGVPIGQDLFDQHFAVYNTVYGYSILENPQLEKELIQVVAFLIFLSYSLISESFFNKTIGKVITCTVVRRKKSFGKANFWRILLRTFCRMIPFDGLSFLGTRPVGWHDSISGTVVVNSIYSYAAFYDRIRKTNKGYQRLHWVISIIAAIPTFGLGFLGYWILVRIALWIIDGFSEEKIPA